MARFKAVDDFMGDESYDVAGALGLSRETYGDEDGGYSAGVRTSRALSAAGSPDDRVRAAERAAARGWL